MDASFEDFGHPNSTLHAERKSTDCGESEVLLRKRPHLTSGDMRHAEGVTFLCSVPRLDFWLDQTRKPGQYQVGPTRQFLSLVQTLRGILQLQVESSRFITT
ncbi:hypothetical protein DL93DRAFT_2076464 [Clavulina sp. PMI_390]|nr:hypothetical protein DL93DRAFT_2076464 [Clavulina sp. PMI_390]